MTDFRDDLPIPPRDEVLGAALRSLEVPEHRDGFFDQLEVRLRGEAPAAVVPLEAGRRRRAWRRQALRLAVVAAAASVIGVAVGVNLDSPVTEPAPGASPRVVALDAQQVSQRMQAALSDVRTLRGEIVFRDPEAEVRAKFVVTADGDFRQSGITRQEELAYDSRTGVERGYFIDPTGPDFGGERTGIAPGRPDGGPANWILRRQLGSTVRAFLDSDARPTVQETTFAGRDAWLLEMDVEPNKIGGGADHLEITVDQETGYPVRVVETIAGELFQEVVLQSLVTDGPVERGEFTVQFPPGIEVSRFDEGWRRHESPATAADAVGYAPLVPSDAALPEGFVLSQISTAKRTPQGTGVEGLNPPTRDAVSLAYHRGLDQVLVTMRKRGPIVDGRSPGIGPGDCSECLGNSSWSDPLASGEGFFDDPEELTVAAGALAGSPAQLLIGAHTTPHVWAVGEELVVTVSGDATRAELLEIIESLEPYAG